MTEDGRTAVAGRLGAPRHGLDPSPDCRMGVAHAPCYSRLPDLLARDRLGDVDPARDSREARFVGHGAR
jgi:hypothetical protein